MSTCHFRKYFSTVLSAVRSKDFLNFALLIGVSVLLRIYFFQGFVLGDDPEETGMVRYIREHQLMWDNQITWRFGMWFPGYFSVSLLGWGERAFFASSVFVSGLMSGLVYILFRQWNYDRWVAMAAGLFAALSPFEVLQGTCRVNDLFLACSILLGIILICMDTRDLNFRALGLSFCLFYAFHVKLWAVYAFPVLTLMFLSRCRKANNLSAFGLYVGSSIGLHLAISVLWKLKTGFFIPWLQKLPGNAAVPPELLWSTFAIYPHYLFYGTFEHGRTLFGWVPYLAVFFGVLGVVIRVLKQDFSSNGDISKHDGSNFPRHSLGAVPEVSRDILWLWLHIGVIFLLLNFFPNQFKFDQFYSVSRIWRYLAWLSVPLSVLAFHETLFVLSFLINKIARCERVSISQRSRAVSAWVILGVLLPIQWIKTTEAHEVGADNRRAVSQIISYTAEHCPSKFVIESWQAHFFINFYLEKWCPSSEVVIIAQTQTPVEYRSRLREIQKDLPTDSGATLLVSGFGSFVYYRCDPCGFWLQAEGVEPLGPEWKIVAEFPPLSYTLHREPVRIWELQSSSAGLKNLSQ